MAEHEHEAEPDSPSSMDQELAKETGKMTVLEIKDEYTYVIPSFCYKYEPAARSCSILSF